MICFSVSDAYSALTGDCTSAVKKGYNIIQFLLYELPVFTSLTYHHLFITTESIKLRYCMVVLDVSMVYSTIYLIIRQFESMMACCDFFLDC